MILIGCSDLFISLAGQPSHASHGHLLAERGDVWSRLDCKASGASPNLRRQFSQTVQNGVKSEIVRFPPLLKGGLGHMASFQVELPKNNYWQLILSNWFSCFIRWFCRGWLSHLD